MDFTELRVRKIEPVADGEYRVTVGYTSTHFIGTPGHIPPEGEAITLNAKPDEIGRLNGLHASEQEIIAWLDGADWDESDLPRYLKSRIRHG